MGRMEGQGKATRASTSQGGTGARSSTPGAGKPLPVRKVGYSPAQAVFGQEELLEMILDYAINDEDMETRGKTLKAVRLVNKSWLTRVTNLMRRNKEPLFKLQLTKDNSLNSSSVVKAQGKVLDVFAKRIVNRVVKETFPTFSLKIYREFFRYENFHSFANFLRQCAEGFVELEMIIPKNGGSLPGGMLCIVDLPVLRKITVSFTDKRVAANLSAKELEFGNSTNPGCLIQRFLDRATSLKEFTVPLDDDGDVFPAPKGFGDVTLPASITSLDQSCEMTSNQLKILTIKKLPSLAKLGLQLSEQYSEGLLSEVLKNLCEHLENLTITELVYQGPPRIRNLVRFPVMKKLNYLRIVSCTFQLDAQHPSLKQCFPKLHTLGITYQTPEMLNKWTKSRPIYTVENFNLSLIDENKSHDSSGYILPLTLESMQGVNLTFPNIRELTLELSSGMEASGLKFLFKEMTQLTFLYIEVNGSESIASSDLWDSTFTGFPISVVTALRENPDFWTHLEVKDSAPSIRMLTKLETLGLEAVGKNTNVLTSQPLISDLTFTFALLKMPLLSTLQLYGRFSATSTMTEAWKREGRKLEYSASFQPT